MNTMAQEEQRFQSDHDILITLVETVKNNQVTVVEKIGDVKDKVQEVNDGLNAKVSEHEVRLKSIERLVGMVAPEQSYKEFQVIKEWVDDFKRTYKTTLITTGLISAIGGAILTLMAIITGLFKIVVH